MKQAFCSLKYKGVFIWIAENLHVNDWWNAPSIDESIFQGGHNEPEPTSALSRMNGKWSGDSFLLGCSSLANYVA